jgi:hypothetical protein
VSIVNNGIISVSLEARSRRRERTGEVGKRRARGSGGEGREEKGKEGREREGKRWGKADNERCTYQQVPTAVLATLRSGGTEEDGPFMHVVRCGQRREEMRSTKERKSMNKLKKRKGKERKGRKELTGISCNTKGQVTRVPKPIHPFLDPRPGQRSDRAYDDSGALMGIASTHNNDTA